ncbi:hypothetical protein JCM11491_003748 [Sporobolomyces phaffii]
MAPQVSLLTLAHTALIDRRLTPVGTHEVWRAIDGTVAAVALYLAHESRSQLDAQFMAALLGRMVNPAAKYPHTEFVLDSVTASLGKVLPNVLRGYMECVNVSINGVEVGISSSVPKGNVFYDRTWFEKFTRCFFLRLEIDEQVHYVPSAPPFLLRRLSYLEYTATHDMADSTTTFLCWIDIAIYVLALRRSRESTEGHALGDANEWVDFIRAFKGLPIYGQGAFWTMSTWWHENNRHLKPTLEAAAKWWFPKDKDEANREALYAHLVETRNLLNEVLAFVVIALTPKSGDRDGPRPHRSVGGPAYSLGTGRSSSTISSRFFPQSRLAPETL